MRIQTGNVLTVQSSTDRWLVEIQASRAFSRGVLLAASVGNFSEIELFNPGGSGKTFDVWGIIASTGAAGAVELRTHNLALATLVGVGLNLKTNAGAGVGELRTATPAAADGTLIGAVLAAVNTPLYLTELWAAELVAGNGLIVTNNAVNVAISALFRWIEY